MVDTPTGQIATTWRVVLLRDPCVYCGAPAEGLDHIRPRCAGGRDGWENRAPACSECDSAKSGNLLIGFLLGSTIAAKTVARRKRYADAVSRHAALRAIRDDIAKRFYGGNIRLVGVEASV